MNKVSKPSIFFGLVIALVFFVGLFMMTREGETGLYVMYAGFGLGIIYWIWAVIAVITAGDLKKYQRTFWLIIVVAAPYFGALIFSIMHRYRNRMVA